MWGDSWRQGRESVPEGRSDQAAQGPRYAPHYLQGALVWPQVLRSAGSGRPCATSRSMSHCQIADQAVQRTCFIRREGCATLSRKGIK
jgi:hypothetical protein